VDGLKVNAIYQMDAASYDGGLNFDGFRSSRIDRWLALAGIDTNGAVSLTGNWRGGGNLKDGKHHGGLTLNHAEMQRANAAPVSVEGEARYDWPGLVTLQKLQVRANDQLLGADLKMAGGMLELSGLRWRDHDADMATGSAKLPVPEDFSKWREALAHDKRPVEVSLESKVLSLGLLNDWLPASAKLDARSTGKLCVKVSGTFADPSVEVAMEARNLRSPAQPKLPPADLTVDLTGSGGLLKVRGKATAPDFPPAVMTASMAFLPARWAEAPGSIMDEPVSARVDLPRLDLSRFSQLVTAAKRISGTVTANLEAGGTVGKPAVKGGINLANGGFELKSGRSPALTDVGLAVELAQDRVTLKNLKGTMAGGTLAGGGTLAITNGKPGAIDLRVTGNHLPLLRDESVIVRANAGLRLSGTLEKAALTGTVGVVDSLFYRDIELLPIGTPFTGPSAAALPKVDAPSKPAASLPEPFRSWTLDVLLRTENPFLIRGNLATGAVTAKLKVGGTLGSPAPAGEVRLKDLRAALPFSTLVVPSGSLRFDPSTGFDPLLEIRGSAEPRPYRVSVYVYGRASNPQLVLTSSPPLPENEIMTLLATGTTTSGLENPQAASSRAMQLLAEELRRGRFAVGKQLRPLLGLLDRVDFSLAESDPYSSDSFSTATISITDRWFLSAGMGAEGDSRVMGIWRISFR
jgi:hypothetical protein